MGAGGEAALRGTCVSPAIRSPAKPGAIAVTNTMIEAQTKTDLVIFGFEPASKIGVTRLCRAGLLYGSNAVVVAGQFHGSSPSEGTCRGLNRFCLTGDE